MRTSSIKFTGLASGLDTDSIVSSLVSPYKSKVDYSEQEKQLLELKKEAYQEMNSKIYGFYTKYIDKMRLNSSFNKTNVTLSNLNAIAIDKNATIPEGNHSFEVIQMAKGAMVETATIKTTANTTASKETNLSEFDIKDEYQIQINNELIKINGSSKIGDIESALKEKLGKDVSVKFDEKISGFIISSAQTGENISIDIQLLDKNGNRSLELENAIGIKSGIYKGQDASIKYNGGMIISSPSNQLEVNDIKFSIIGEAKGPVTITATKDTEQVVEFVKEFVDEYNKLIEDIEKMVSADSAKGYRPLTEEQKKEMSDSDIELWNKKIKNSILRRDSTLSSISNSMREILGGVVGDNTYKTLANIGITTGSWNEKGKLYVDESKLRKSLIEDTDGVINLFSGNGDETKAKQLYASEGGLEWNKLTFEEKNEWLEKTGTVGIGDRLYNEMKKAFKGSTNKSANFLFNDKLLDKQISKEKERVTELEEKMYRMEELYYKKFTAMEKQLSLLNNQSNWLTSQLGGM